MRFRFPQAFPISLLCPWKTAYRSPVDRREKGILGDPLWSTNLCSDKLHMDSWVVWPSTPF